MLDPTFMDAHYNLANVMLKLKGPEETVEEAVIHYNIVIGLDQQAPQAAEQQAAAAEGDEYPVKWKPLVPKQFALCNLGKALCFHSGDSDKGIQ